MTSFPAILALLTSSGSIFLPGVSVIPLNWKLGYHSGLSLLIQQKEKENEIPMLARLIDSSYQGELEYCSGMKVLSGIHEIPNGIS